MKKDHSLVLVSRELAYFEQCDRGTIFLDEIGDMPLTAQTKILRALQEGEIQRVGGTEVIKVDVRILAATNKSMEEMVKENAFREDLYYRLNVVRILMPALRQRKEDIPLLINFMLQNLAKKNRSVANTISKEALDMLVGHDWPGNVRELENIVHRSAVLAQGNTILPKDLPEEIIQKTLLTPQSQRRENGQLLILVIQRLILSACLK